MELMPEVMGHVYQPDWLKLRMRPDDHPLGKRYARREATTTYGLVHAHPVRLHNAAFAGAD
jgi:hypothetical protein